MAPGRTVNAARPNDATKARSTMALSARARVWSGVVLRSELLSHDASAASVDPITLSSECETPSVSSQPAGLMP